MDVSSVHWPDSRPKGPPPTMSSDGCETTGAQQLQGGAQGVTGRQPRQAATEAGSRIDFSNIPSGTAPSIGAHTRAAHESQAKLASVVDLLNSLPQLPELGQSPVPGAPVPHQPAADHGAGPAHAAPSSARRRFSLETGRNLWRPKYRPSRRGCAEQRRRLSDA